MGAILLPKRSRRASKVGLEKAWRYCEERDMPRFIYISKTDEDNSDYNATF